MKIGLTGGIGCGKSTVAALFEQAGFKRCDTDALVKQFLAEDAKIISAIAEHFGANFVSNQGGVSRQKLAEIVFKEKSELEWLENLLHPRVLSTWKKWVSEAPKSHWCIEIPLLFEKNLEKHFDFTVCVRCSIANQLSRLLSRGLSEEQALARNALQMPLIEKVERSGFVLSNDGNESFLRAQTNYFIENFVQRCA